MAVSQETAEAYIRWINREYGEPATFEQVLSHWDEFFDNWFRNRTEKDEVEVEAAWVRLSI